ncbi:MAG: protein kinase domain-containing protein, partial [Halanaerobiales bacterium]
MVEIITRDGKEYIAEKIFTARKPRSRVVLEKVNEIKEILAREPEFNESSYIQYQGIEKVEGEYCLFRKDEEELAPLADYLANGEVSIARALSWVLKQAELWQKAEEKGFTWELITLEYLRVTDEGEIKLINPVIGDIIARYRSDMEEIIDRDNYRAPEVIEGHEADTTSRIYNLGVIFYYLLTGKAPFAGENKTDIYDRIITSSLIEPRYINHEISAALNDVILQLLEPERDKRPDNWQKLIAVLNQVKGNCYAGEREQEENLRNSGRKIKLTRLKEKLHFFRRRHWKKTVVALLLIVALIIAGRTGQRPPVVTEETAPREVVEYFYESINENDVTKIQATTSLDLGNMERMLSESYVMQKMRKAYGDPEELEGEESIFGVE